jgi:hypothetical protein
MVGGTGMHHSIWHKIKPTERKRLALLWREDARSKSQWFQCYRQSLSKQAGDVAAQAKTRKLIKKVRQTAKEIGIELPS